MANEINSEMDLTPSTAAPNTKTVHVGLKPYQALTVAAIEISYQCKRQFTASQVMRYLIERYTSDAVAKMIAEYKPSETTS
ncbi:hypothetical protein [Pseudomonas sp. F1002]|uniref:hypothetical protein n=1 Tax=Pseudomonas sp. F1002 TaxID=2738821 RepID=UPI0021095921|nr:hypothetical protein [Pseudomonas sp. F1002]